MGKIARARRSFGSLSIHVSAGELGGGGTQSGGVSGRQGRGDGGDPHGGRAGGVAADADHGAGRVARADGSDVALVDVEAVDAQGERCPTFERAVAFET